MKYQQPTFTLPASNGKVSQQEWNRIFNKQCAWVYTDGGQYQGQCMKVATHGNPFCEEHSK
jgi:hypothetical protein